MLRVEFIFLPPALLKLAVAAVTGSGQATSTRATFKRVSLAAMLLSQWKILPSPQVLIFYSIKEICKRGWTWTLILTGTGVLRLVSTSPQRKPPL